MFGILTKTKKTFWGLHGRLFPKAYKKRAELQYWKWRHAEQKGKLSNSHYEPLFTSLFGLEKNDYMNKRVLDIGCGPRGSLEWATIASQRVGLDPLANEYLKLGASEHKMQYVASGSEKIPFPDAHFDIVTCLNALDHVDDLQQTINEIKRVVKPGGFFLLSVETDHAPTAAVPILATMEHCLS